MSWTAGGTNRVADSTSRDKAAGMVDGPRFRYVGSFCSFCLAMGCSGSSSPTAEAPRYYEDVAPLLNEHCTSCHRSGRIAPFELTSYGAASARAKDIAAATRARTMPPMPVDNSGSCNTFANARWLSDAEIELLSRWERAGAPAGDPAHAPPPAPPESALDSVDVLLDLGFDYRPQAAAGDDEYRCFVLPPAVDENAFMTAYQVQPGDARVVHHVIVYQPSGAEAQAEAQQLDDDDTGPGYSCFGSPGIDAAPLAMWAPGSGVTRLPEGTGLPLIGGRRLVMQVHYNVENGSFPARTQVQMQTTRDPLIAATQLALVNSKLMLPPGLENTESSSTLTFTPATTFTVHGAMPHMHILGRTLHVDATEDGESRCLVNVDRWDFHWQNAWWYTTPLSFHKIQDLSIRCGYDTRSRSETTTWGERTVDEMCLSYFYITGPQDPEPPLSCRDAANPLFGSCVDSFFNGCYEPDMSGLCHAEAGGLSWSDGSRIVTRGADAGIYGPDGSDPCIRLSATATAVKLERDDGSLSYSSSSKTIAFECPDGTSLEASPFQFREFAMCRGLSCPP